MGPGQSPGEDRRDQADEADGAADRDAGADAQCGQADDLEPDAADAPPADAPPPPLDPFAPPPPLDAPPPPLDPNANTVVDRYSCPGLRIVDGNSGLFGESGKCCVSRQKPARRP